ncbi:hypothetical protein [Streptomyces sp. NPDC054842]
MPAYTRRTVDLFLLLALSAGTAGVLAGCGDERQAGSHRARASQDRAREVAEAWDGSEEARAWRTGYHPVGDLVRLPDHAFRSDADKRAYVAGVFVLAGELPPAPRRPGQVRWRNGDSLTLPLLDARETYGQVARGGDQGPHLTVTGAELGEMTVDTSRGPATVPAWLFTLKGYDTPLGRVALDSSKTPRPPIGPAGGTPTDDLAPLLGLAGTAGDGRSVTVMAGHGSCDDGPAVDVLETKGSVVLSAYVVGADDGPCTSDLRSKEVTVKLDRPLGDRLLLDAFTGRPVPREERKGTAASGS